MRLQRAHADADPEGLQRDDAPVTVGLHVGSHRGRTAARDACNLGPGKTERGQIDPFHLQWYPGMRVVNPFVMSLLHLLTCILR